MIDQETQLYAGEHNDIPDDLEPIKIQNNNLVINWRT